MRTHGMLQSQTILTYFSLFEPHQYMARTMNESRHFDCPQIVLLLITRVRGYWSARDLWRGRQFSVPDTCCFQDCTGKLTGHRRQLAC